MSVATETAPTGETPTVEVRKKLIRRPGLGNILAGLSDTDLESLRRIWQQRYGESLEDSLRDAAAGKRKNSDTKPKGEGDSAGDEPTDVNGSEGSGQVCCHKDLEAGGGEGILLSPEQIAQELKAELAGMDLAPLRRRRNAVCYAPGEHSLISELLARLQLEPDYPLDRWCSEDGPKTAED